ncbi:MAG: bifunctional nuclease family protein [Prevotella sp.]|nr:bifunctional nuclease family protein [Prevotella sp.]
MPLVSLTFQGASEIIGSDDMGILVLTTADEKWQVSVVCELRMLNQILMRNGHAQRMRDRLPEVLWRMLGADQHKYQIEITSVTDGKYFTQLVDLTTQVRMELRASDAVLLAVISGMPLLIDTEVLRKQAVPFDAKARGVMVPANVVTEEMLRKALDQAIQQEDYEQAAKLNKELQRRRHGTDDVPAADTDVTPQQQ